MQHFDRIRMMSRHLNKLEIFGIADTLASLHDDGDRETVQALRERLVLSTYGGPGSATPLSLLGALDDLFQVSGKWARGVEKSAKPTRRAAERAIRKLSQ
jgi:hypothetical protein